MLNTTTDLLAEADALALLRRMELWPQLLRRQQEEQIAALVPLPDDWLQEQRQQLLAGEAEADVLRRRGWQPDDLELHLRRPEAIRRFAQQHFGPGLEETFLGFRGGRDVVIYSLLRVRDAALARELWIRLEEGETTFAEAATQFSEGPEAHRKGVMGPMEIGQLQPDQLVQWLRALQPGQIRPPEPLGEWHVLLRLEQLTPARFDDEMRQRLLHEALDALLDSRVQRLLAGETLEPLHYDPDA
jgi:parvulin-like peptidyl-prolyl isomerase